MGARGKRTPAKSNNATKGRNRGGKESALKIFWSPERMSNVRLAGKERNWLNGEEEGDGSTYVFANMKTRRVSLNAKGGTASYTGR